MKSAFFTAIRQIEIRDEPKPSISQPDEVLLRIDRLGVCGSDVHYFTDGRIGDDVVPLPASLGHECSGTVVEIGSGVKSLVVGNRVAVDPAVACGTCDQCVQGRSNTCRSMKFMGCPNQGPGAAAEFRVLPANNCIAVPESISLDQAALVEPLAVGFYAVRMAALRPDTNIAILGSGPIGLSVLLSAKATGTCTTFVTDLLDARLAVARTCGADWTKKTIKNDPTAAEELEKAIRDQNPNGQDVVFECTGDPNCIDQAQRILTPGGTLIMIGITPETQVSFDAHLMRRTELTFKNVRRQESCMKPVIDLMAAGKINADPMLTHHYPLDKIQDAFELVAGYEDGVVKAMVEISG
ncbi:MAG: alcohol dehydrogenase catalytic domain-containing protein [Pirellulales bacterium]|nr:alcohol dehydrogenase catalytic domain-containing protein [Pirellulales bacterium]